MNLYYLNPLNLIKEVFFPTHTYFKEAQKRPDYSSQSLENFRVFPEEDFSKISKRISHEVLALPEKEKKDIERKVRENMKAFSQLDNSS